MDILRKSLDFQYNQTDVSALIRRKIHSYLHPLLQKSRLSPTIQDEKRVMFKKVLKRVQFPDFRSLSQLLQVEKEFTHVYRERIDYNFEECFYIFLKIVCLAISEECAVCETEIRVDQSVIIEALAFVSESLVEMGSTQIAFFFAAVAIEICEYYKQLFKIGGFLLVMAKISRKLFRYTESIVYLKKALEYVWLNRKHPAASNLELDIYNELSYNFLQTSLKEDSKLFALKYEIGYLEAENSQIIQLSQELIHSVQKRVSAWTRVRHKNFQLIFSIDLQKVVERHSQKLRKSIDQNFILEIFKVNFDSFYERFLKKEMFFYEIPLPLQLRNVMNAVKTKTHSDNKFVLKTRSKSNASLAPKKRMEKVQQNLILNYRGVGHSRDRLTSILVSFMGHLRHQQGIKLKTTNPSYKSSKRQTEA